jgi:hypothetical protein
VQAAQGARSLRVRYAELAKRLLHLPATVFISKAGAASVAVVRLEDSNMSAHSQSTFLGTK